MQDNNNPQDQVLDSQETQNEVDGLEAVKKATEAALQASGVGEVKNENPAVAEILEGAGSSEKKESPKIVGLSDARQEVGNEAPVKDVVEDSKGGGVSSTVANGGTGVGADTRAEGSGVEAPSAEVKKEPEDKVLAEVIKKIRDAENVLVALSNDPSVDEMAGAIGLSLALDMVGKHTTAIYSGKTPNVLEFLKPEETFEMNANVLQDFVIALNKDKADHLRYKIEGDYVKVYVTPYKSLISEGDLEFSRGDYNVDLVIALNVPAATELDAALREYGRIMHDATSINITNEVAGKFGDVEWVDSKASSVSEMVARLVMELDDKIDAGVATALLTGIVAATDKFANQATSPEVMVLAAKLMEFGANQQAVFKNISQKLEFRERNDVLATSEAPEVVARDVDTSKLTVGHNGLADSVEGGEMEKYVDLSAESAREEARGIVGLGDARSEVGGEERAGIDEMGSVADELKAQQAGYEEAVQDSSVQGRGGILGSVQSVLQSVLNKNGTEGDSSASGDNMSGSSFVVGGEGGSETGADSVVNEILGGINNGGAGTPTLSPSENNGVANAGALNGMPDYGKMIDEALNEKMPGEEGAEEPGRGALAGADTGVLNTPAEGVGAMPAVNTEAVQVETPVMAPTETPVAGSAPGVADNEGVGVNDSVLPMPGSELGVPPAPVVTDINGLPQMPPVVDLAPSGEATTQAVEAGAMAGGVGAVQPAAPELGIANGGTTTLNAGAFGTVAPEVNATNEGTVAGAAPEGVTPGAPVANPPVDPGQFRIPG